MRTPKRKHCDIYKCPKCGGWGITYTADDVSNALHQCSLCGSQFHMAGLPKRTQAIRARWKRKNRDRQQRRIIAALANLCEQAQGQVQTVANCYYRLLELDASSAMGQDIEGS